MKHVFTLLIFWTSTTLAPAQNAASNGAITDSTVTHTSRSEFVVAPDTAKPKSKLIGLGRGSYMVVSDTAEKVPFGFADFTWMNGNNRQASPLLDSKYFTGSVIFDANYNYSFNRPIDNTLVASTVVSRHNELSILLASIGGEFHYKNVRAVLNLQIGSTTDLVQVNDGSITRGQYVANTYQYLREAYGGYHFNKWHGINLDFGIFMSYIGLESYITQENWNYQPSFVCDFTPFFFNGARLQMFPTEKLKVELWLTNGWQSYAKFNNSPGVGYQVNYRPTKNLSLVFNGYRGADTELTPDRIRWHSDNSVLLRYYDAPNAKFFNRAAFSFTGDYGFENGGGVSAKDQYFAGFGFANRFQFYGNKFAVSPRISYVTNPGRYLALYPGYKYGFIDLPLDASGNQIFAGSQIQVHDFTLTTDFMPNDYVTFRLEFNNRNASIPYFAGHGGTTSDTGWINTGTPPPGWKPDLVKYENRLTFAINVRL